jgi:hypothetical protein
MKKLFASALLPVMSLLVSTIAAEPTPAEQFRELQKAYNAVSGEFRKAETDQQRKAAVEHLDGFPGKFLELADGNPTDPVALKALRQAVQAVISVDSLAQHAREMNRDAFPAGSQGDSAGRIVEILLRDHLESDKLAPICDRMRFGARREFEEFLGSALESNPHRDVQGLACLALAQLLHNQLRMIDLAEDRPEMVPQYDHIFGNGYLEGIRGTGRSSLAERVEALYERATGFDDVVNLPFQETVAAKAESELYDLRHLTPGKVAPDIEGRDQDGRFFKLSEYRGKVVLLYFWMEY